MYDFSGISTKKLKSAIRGFDREYSSCEGINCQNNKCPLYGKICSGSYGDQYPNDDIHELFKEELNRREKDMNEQPTLVAGMIVEYTSREFGELGLYLYVNDDWGLGLSENSKQSLSGDVSVSKIFNIGENKSSNYNGLKSKLKLIWSKKSDKDIKIEELQQSMTNLEDNHSKAVAETLDDKLLKTSFVMVDLNKKIDDLLLVADHRWDELKKAKKRIEELEAENNIVRNCDNCLYDCNMLIRKSCKDWKKFDN